jgi:hypothetical protein
LSAHWINLNIDDPNLSLAGYPQLSPGPAVIEAIFRWMVRCGINDPGLGLVLVDHVREADSCPSLMEAMYEFAREWLAAHPDDESAGLIHGALASTTKSGNDVQCAVAWYRSHQKNKTAGFVLVGLLELSRATGTSADPYIIDQAKRRWRNKELRAQCVRILSSLIGVCADDEVVAWVKEKQDQSFQYFLLLKLLEIAPDEETLSIAINLRPRWKGYGMEPDLLIAILNVDPHNRRARRWAREWMNKNPKEEHVRPLRTLLSISDAHAKI